MARVSPLEYKVRQARSRLARQSLLRRGVTAVCIALGLALVWFFLQPLLIPTAPPHFQWALAFGLTGAGLFVATVVTFSRLPNRFDAALQLDRKFQLRERLTTALNLDDSVRDTEIGQALIQDANAKAETLVVKQQFPVGLPARAWWIPAQALALVLVAWLYHPNLSSSNADSGTGKELEAGKKPDDPSEKLVANKPPIRKPPERKHKSEALKDLEKELDKFYGETKPKPEENKAEQTRARAEELASTEEKLKKFVSEQTEKLINLQEQLSKLNTPDGGENKPEGFDKEFREAMQKGDLDKAKAEIDELKKKLKEQGLTEEEQQKLNDQMKSLAEKLERIAKNEKEQNKLKDLIDQAKKEGRDADALERELKRLQEEAEKHEELKNLAKALGQCKKCLEQKDFDGLAEKLGDLSSQLEDIQDQLGDLSDAEEHLQNLKEIGEELLRDLDRDGNMKDKNRKVKKRKRDDDPARNDDADGPGVASGRRPENPDAKSDSQEERQRGLFDARGRKTYGGSVDGPAFKKKTSVEMSGEIQEAVQEAAEAMEVQRLRKSDQQAVKEYFERLGKQGK